MRAYVVRKVVNPAYLDEPQTGCTLLQSLTQRFGAPGQHLSTFFQTNGLEHGYGHQAAVGRTWSPYSGGQKPCYIDAQVYLLHGRHKYGFAQGFIGGILG